MGISLNPYMPFYSLPISMSLMIYSGYPYPASVEGQKLSLEIQNLFSSTVYPPSSTVESGEQSEYIY